MTTDKPLPSRVTIAQAADYLSVSQRSVRRYIAGGYLTAVRIGPRLIRIERESLIKMAQPRGMH